jgi:uncharacterized protein DUF4350
VSESQGQGRGWLVVMVVLGLAVGAFFLTCEPVDSEFHRGYTGEAARNHYLAAERLLGRMGMPARSVSDVGALGELPGESSTIVIPTARRSFDPATNQRLLDWVERGGHLVVVTWQLWDDPKRTPDPILDPLGIEQFSNDDDADDDDTEQAPPDAQPETPDSPDTQTAPGDDASDDEPADAAPDDDPDADAGDPPDYAEADFPDREQPLRVRFDPGFRLELADEAPDALILEIGDDDGSHWLTLRHGKGLLTALTDDYFMTQPKIGDLDHAELVYRMSRLGGHRGIVWFVTGDQRPSALSLVLRHGWMVVASAALLLGLWLWSASRRFGPLRSEGTSARRELMEHVRAAGRLQWRAGAGRELLDAVRTALFTRMRERHPGFESLDPAGQARALETLSGVPRARVADALAFGDETDAAHFAAKVAILDKLRRSL